MKNKVVIVFFGCLFFLLWSGVSQAGQIWIVSDKFKVRKGDRISLYLGQGVSFPKSYELIFKEGLEFIHHRPDGKKTLLPLKPGKMVYEARVDLEEPGTHIITAAEGIKLAKTSRGWKLVRDKKKKTIGRSLILNKFTKTFIKVGTRSSDFKKIIGARLEIVPLRDPSNLHVGDKLKLKVLFDGKSLEMITIKATYSGYSGREDRVPVKKITDLMGQTDIELTRAGPWFVYTYKIIQEKKKSRRRDKEVFESSLVFYVNK